MPAFRPLGPSDPSKIASYRVTGRIGEGGQGVVYAAETGSGEPVAVKLLHRRFSDDERVRRDFGTELRQAQRVTDPRIARILAYGLHDRRLYYASEYVDGPSLWDVVEKQGPRPANELTELAIATLTALAAVHEAGTAHGDFRPGCVLLGPGGPRVIDFGVGRALEGPLTTGRLVGTSPFTAPEHLAGTLPGPESDMFAWAGTIVYAATGRAPFGQDSVPAVINRILNGVPDLSALAGGLRDAVDACLDKVPARRPSARELLTRLEGLSLGYAPLLPPAIRPAAPEGRPKYTARWPAPPPSYEGPIPLSARPLWPRSGQTPLPGRALPPAAPPETAGRPGAAARTDTGLDPAVPPDARSSASRSEGGAGTPPFAAGHGAAFQSRPGTVSFTAGPGPAPFQARPRTEPSETGRAAPLRPDEEYAAGPDRQAGSRHRRRHRRDRAIAAAAGLLLTVLAVVFISSSEGRPQRQVPGAIPVPTLDLTAPPTTEPPVVPTSEEPTPIPSPSKSQATSNAAPSWKGTTTRVARPLLEVTPSRVRVRSDYIISVNIKLKAPGAAIRWRASISEGGLLSSTRGEISAGSSATITAYGTPYCSTSKIRFTSNGGDRTVRITWGGVLC
ncbi:hypothetical protein GCM10022226_50150 [Sphaerisporangium flaviroseum]|uniref:Protein kinase domain-containing protein n=1 Tax=Sphaerisporangium flaviroseum TaxID=509199 RepID=A0ABP7IPC2_9ACTN